MCTSGRELDAPEGRHRKELGVDCRFKPIAAWLWLLTLSFIPHDGVRAASAYVGQVGVVVEAVAKGSEAERAELREGDVLVRWSRADAEGAVESPFDLAAIEVEQTPRGPVTFAGRRGAEERRWTLGPSIQGIDARPHLSEPLLASHRAARGLIEAGKIAEAAEKWRAIAAQAGGSEAAGVAAWAL